MDNDSVNHPNYYSNGGIEAIEVIEAWDLGFHLGNTVKYISRAGKKNPDKEIEDLQKARWYLDKHIENRCKAQGVQPFIKLNTKRLPLSDSNFKLYDTFTRLMSVILIVSGVISILAEKFMFGASLMIAGLATRMVLMIVIQDRIICNLKSEIPCSKDTGNNNGTNVDSEDSKSE